MDYIPKYSTYVRCSMPIFGIYTDIYLNDKSYIIVYLNDLNILYKCISFIFVLLNYPQKKRKATIILK